MALQLQSSFSSSSTHSTYFSFSSSFNHAYKYDVFISFRGQDTRYGFTGYLYEALSNKGIHSFIDDQELQKGDEITPSLLRSIQESRIAIIVLSPNYASSSFCLDELVHILHYIKGNNRLVLPVFYKVDPSDVRHLKKSFGEAMAKHEERFKNDMNKVHKWKKALHQIANLSGYHFKDGDGYEHKFIKNIVENISRKVKFVPLPVADYPVGLESRVPEVISLLKMDYSDQVHMVGIHGIGGIGKTILALAVYNVIVDSFEGKDEVHIVGVKEGTSLIQQRLSRKKVLLVLDDVDDCRQLQAVAGKLVWFGPGSRVIITTRDTHLLKCHGVQDTYEVDGLNMNDSFQLLIKKAFENDNVSPGYTDVLNRAIAYASGNPLALELIGSNLFGKEVQVWESALDHFEKHLDKKMREILRVSFDALGKEEQSVFLDIACCFKGHSLVEVIDLLQAHYGSCMEYHIGVLVEKSLIKTNKVNGIVTMHDLIEDLGKEIVFETSPAMPGKRSRLWFYEDIIKVLEDNQGSSAIEIIYLEFPLFKGGEVKWDGKAFKEMKNLKTLIIKNGCFSKSPKHLPNSLRVLEWWRYPSEYFPYDFQPKELSVLKLHDNCFMSSMLNSLFKLGSLKVLELEICDSLKEIPDVSNLQNLEELWFRRCSNLIRIHRSVGFLNKLKTLKTTYCKKLRSFPPAIKLPSLEQLILQGCSSLKYFPEILEEMENVKVLDLNYTGIKDLPCSFRNLSGLRRLEMIGDEMCKIPSVITMMPQLCECMIDGGGNSCRERSLQMEMILEKLIHCIPSSDWINCCFQNINLSDDFFPLAVVWFPNVSSLNLSGNNFSVLPECIQQFHLLRELIVNDCEHLREIRGIPPKLERFSAINCKLLSPWGTTVLLNQDVHEGRSTRFVMPGGSIPRWFERRFSGASISLWFRGTKFPNNALCVAILLKDYISVPIEISLTVAISGNEVCYGEQARVNQLFIFNLNLQRYHHILTLQKGWNHAELSCKARYNNSMEVSSIEFIVKEIRMHVWKQKIGSSIIEDIRFSDPYKMTELIIMMMMLSMVFPNHKRQPLLMETCIGLWTLLFLSHTYFE
ncbi:hypothetical protein PIB30_017692 [Stylosanthes scabra]|uniref:TIR domain-containing protein n=1 Tax=Stylosanthes scabra TaxID=79078 RepID=A0ABU6Q8E6_9FABA|nr:hypothetical protein [Stylosanthes scabra]